VLCRFARTEFRQCSAAASGCKAAAGGWPSDRADLKLRVGGALVLLLLAKVATLAVPFTFKSVSYTLLTLPTIYSVSISVVAVSFTKKYSLYILNFIATLRLCRTAISFLLPRFLFIQ